LGDKWHRFSLQDRYPSSHPANSVKALNETPAMTLQSVACPHPFFTHHSTPDRRDTAPFTMALQRQDQVYLRQLNIIR